MPQWFDDQRDMHPEDSGELPLTKPNGKSLWKFIAVFVAIWLLIALVVLLSGCSRPNKYEWRAAFRIEYANGQRITSAEADSPNWRAQNATEVPAK